MGLGLQEVGALSSLSLSLSLSFSLTGSGRRGAGREKVNFTASSLCYLRSKCRDFRSGRKGSRRGSYYGSSSCVGLEPEVADEGEGGARDERKQVGGNSRVEEESEASASI
ncbi:hypothetical protein KFK09_015284 [Dendrobium nobile]|uniref:Uncharacterized protein n=1 Tax=Dendrobium nobile TaxID=94219 RepID=A0A8T3B5J8_DENNO|nr:hypothetical protein KFK09_015284 [Dendrobium nobile]